MFVNTWTWGFEGCDGDESVGGEGNRFAFTAGISFVLSFFGI